MSSLASILRSKPSSLSLVAPFTDLASIAEIEVIQESVTRINPVTSFETAGLHPVMLENVKLAGYQVPTPIQAYTLPAVFKGYDLVACAQTGKSLVAFHTSPSFY